MLKGVVFVVIDTMEGFVEVLLLFLLCYSGVVIAEYSTFGAHVLSFLYSCLIITDVSDGT